MILTTKPVTAVFNTSSALEMKRIIEDGKPNQAVTLFAPVGVAEDLSKTQYLLCGEIKQELKLLKQSITAIPFQELTKQIQELAINLEVCKCVPWNSPTRILKISYNRGLNNSHNWTHLFWRDGTQWIQS